MKRSLFALLAGLSLAAVGCGHNKSAANTSTTTPVAAQPAQPAPPPEPAAPPPQPEHVLHPPPAQ